DIGAFRSQYPRSLAGKILRINPATGGGYPSNPFYDGDPQSNQSKVWTYGHRNPWRDCIRPRTGSLDPADGRPGTLYVGDVGWNNWEELDVARTGGLNFGWPCLEGPVTEPSYAQVTPAHHGCDTWGTPGNPSYPTAPVVTYHHSQPALGTPPGFTGYCVIGGLFYTGALYPSEYRNRYVIADYGGSWIRFMTFDENDA